MTLKPLLTFRNGLIALFASGLTAAVAGLISAESKLDVKSAEPTKKPTPVFSKPAEPATAGQFDQTASSPLLIFYATPYGFEPQTLTVSAGPKRLMIRNRTGFKNLNFQIKTKTGQTVATLNGSENTIKNLISQNTLTAGEFVLTEAGHPTWKCTLLVK